MVSSEDVRTDGWSSPWAERVEPRERGVLDVLAERQERARARAYRDRRLARILAVLALAGFLVTPFVPFGWVPFWLGVAAGSRGAWIWVHAARDDYEGSLDLGEFLTKSD